MVNYQIIKLVPWHNEDTAACMAGGRNCLIMVDELKLVY